MKVRLLAVGTRMPAWVEAGVEEYRKRLPREMPLEIVEIAPGARGKNADIARAIHSEGDRMLEKLRDQYANDYYLSMRLRIKLECAPRLACCMR